MTRKRTYSLEEAKAVRDKLAELRPDMSEALEKFGRGLQELADVAQNVARAMEESLAPLRGASREWADGGWARKLVVDMARRTLSEVGPDSKIGGEVRESLNEFLNLFATFVPKMEPATQDAVMAMLLNVGFIMLASNDPNDPDLAPWRRKDLAAAMRKNQADSFTPRVAEELDAVHVALKGRKPVDSVKKAEVIQAEVKRILGRKLSLATIRRRLSRLAQMAHS